ncbi:MAG: hypothetical protein ABI665_07825 [Vicinamibacterales bacterium]
MIAAPERRWRFRKRWVFAAVLGVLAVAALSPSSRYIGVNFIVTRQTLPLWIKAVDFVDRDLNLARTSQEVLGGVSGDEARALAALAWTRAHILPAPAGLPIVDDHIWHIIVRGYGQSDQQADVFTVLLAYAGVPAFWGFVGKFPREIPISYVRIEGTWRVFDVARGAAFRDSTGRLASPADIAAHPELIRQTAALHGGDPDGYLEYFAGYQPPPVPDVLRADMQMLGRRLNFEARKLVGRQGEVWQVRPHPSPAPQQEQRP